MLTDDESAELAELRRRAWGDDPDIADDEAALARLDELERKAHPFVAHEPDGERWMPQPEEEPAAEDPWVAERRRLDQASYPHHEPAEQPMPEYVDEEGIAVAERRPGFRPRTLLAGAAALALVAAGMLAGAGVRSILFPPEGSPSPTPVAAADAGQPTVMKLPECGDGWGEWGTLPTPDGRPVWSRAFSAPPEATTVIPASGRRMLAVLANLDVRAGTIADVTVVKPRSARLVYTDVDTWTSPPTSDDLVANGLQSLALPLCGAADSYPGLIISPIPTCVTLEFTVEGRLHYTVDIPVGVELGAQCPAK